MVTRVCWSDTTGMVHTVTASDQTELRDLLDRVLSDHELCVIAITTTPATAPDGAEEVA
jgi:hypothetical protein